MGLRVACVGFLLLGGAGIVGLSSPVRGATGLTVIRQAGSANARQSDFRVTLLGTASPQPRPDRFGPSTLVQAGDQTFVIDAGRGVPIRLRQLGVPLGKVDALFLTHYHSDHTSGIPDLWLTGWLPAPYAQRQTPFRVIGPIGAKNLMAGLEQAYALDIKIRLEDEKLSPAAIKGQVEEFERDGVVYDQRGVKVIAFEVEHGGAIKPAYGYRIEYGGRAITISGDTRYSENVIKYGSGADLLIHEVAAARPELIEKSAPVRGILAHHTTPSEAGLVFARAKPKLAAYTHIVLQGTSEIPEPTLESVVAETRKAYAGPLEVGEDLMTFEIGDAVTVKRFKP